MFRKIVVLIFISLTCAWFALEADDSDATLERPTQPVYQREFPDDAPGIPARRVTGVLPSSPIRFGIATTFQVNVNSLGADILGDAANEPSIAVDPNEPNVMAIGWRQFDTITSNFRQAGWGHTTDGGRTWTFPGVIEPGVFRSDPVLTSDAEGIFYYNSLKVVGGVYSCQVFKSGDGGQTWPTGAEAFGGDKQWFTIDHGNSVGHGNIYQAWNTAAGCCGDTTFNRSTDGGSSFSHPIRIPNTPIFGTLDVDSDGNPYVLGIDPSNWSTFWVAKSTNAKYAQYIPSFDMVTPVYLGGALRFGGGGGSPNPGGLLGQAWIAVDRSGGPTHGNVYVLCSVDPPNVDPLDIYFVRSTDGGQTWSAPIRVNDDAVVSWGWQWFG
ncbi:MAG: exo-alpha-sialidase, partial [Candidatus Krumholzibacteria bacterium]|nr:exo-alpha-sialidase [Candidatus Krumholzibacteria bacterium]